MKCIFCQTEISNEDFSREHIIPKFLGGDMVIHNICKDCNRKFGVNFEQKLGENSIFKFIRAFYRLKARKSRKFVTPDLKLKQSNVIIRTDDEGHLLMYTPPNFNHSDFGIEVDQSESQGIINHMLNMKIKNLHQEGCEEYDYKIVSDIKNLKIGEPEEFNLDMDLLILNELFVKMAYEFTTVCLGNKYFNDSISILLKKTILDENYDFLFDNESSIKLTCDKRKLSFCVNKVCDVAYDNTIKHHYNYPLTHCSNGDYTHEISLIKDNKNFIVLIKLFDIFNYKILVSKNANDYDYDDGLVVKLKMGKHNGEGFNKINSNYEVINLKFNNHV